MKAKVRILIYISLIIIGMGILAVGLQIDKSGNVPTVLKMPCLFHELFHLYCPGCGGTRAFMALLNGRVINAVIYNPFFCYIVGIYLWYLVSEGLWIAGMIRKKGQEQIRGFQFHISMVWIGLGIFLGYCLIRNTAYLIWRIDWTGDFLDFFYKR